MKRIMDGRTGVLGGGERKAMQWGGRSEGVDEVRLGETAWGAFEDQEHRSV